MGRRVEPRGSAGLRRFAGHLADSSLGSAAAAVLREAMDGDDARQVMAHALEIGRAEAAERKRLGSLVSGSCAAGAQIGWDVLVVASGVGAGEVLATTGCPNAARAGESRGAEWQSANELYRSARGAVAGRRPYDAAVLLHKALRLLDGHVDPAHIELRVKSLTTLCWSDVETRGVTDGLVHLSAAERAVAGIADRALRLELTSAVRAQRGVVLMRAGRYAESIPLFGQAIEIDDYANAAGMPNHLVLGAHLLNRAFAYNAVGLPAAAHADLLRCVDVVEHGLRETTADDSRFAVLRAEALHTLGLLTRRDGDVPGALRYFEQARLACREVPRALWFRMKLDQAEALLAAGLAIDAARHLDHALACVGRSGTDMIVADAYALRSAVALAVGDRRLARRYAIDARRRSLRLGNKISAALAGLLGLRAEIAAVLDSGETGPPGLAARARTLAAELTDLRLADEAIVARLLIVRLDLLRGVRPAGLPTLRRISTTEGRVLLRLCRAEIAFADGDRRTVLGQTRAALAELAEIQEISEPIDTVGNGWADITALCALALRVVASAGSSDHTAARLFEWSERVRTTVRRGEPLLPVDDPVLAQRIQEYRRLGRTLREARITNRPLRELAARRRALRTEVLHAGRHGTAAIELAKLDDVVAALGERALISYIVVGEEIVAVVVADGRTRIARLGSSASAFTAARELHADLAALSPDNLPSALVDAVARSARARAHRLDDQLVVPLRDIVADRELVVVPTGMLFAVAWGALPSLTGRPVTVVPSATSWLAAVRVPVGCGGRTVLVGGPGLSPAAVGELGRLRQHRPDAWLLDGEHATTAIVLDALDGAGLAHLGAHGAHEPQNSLFSHLELADGAIFAHDVARLPRPPEHLVLAACELAFSQRQLDHDALGFAGVLLDAGSRTVVAAVSQVGDEPAAAAMAEYHSGLAAGAAPAAALAAAVAVDPLRRPFLCVGASVSS